MRIYLVNVGANARHWSRARSPIFPDGTFRFVSFPDESGVAYPADMRPFTRGARAACTHLDPDWQNLTYGECVSNGRGGALRLAERDDVLLFWGMLCSNTGAGWETFTGERGWYLLGAMRIAWIMEAGQRLRDIPMHYRARAGANAHVEAGWLDDGQRVFIADRSRSALFDRAVDLGAQSKQGLMFQAFRTKAGEPLRFGASPHWSGTLRACRCMFDLENREDRERAKLVHTAIRRLNEFALMG